jgi:hypothetical protein
VPGELRGGEREAPPASSQATQPAALRYASPRAVGTKRRTCARSSAGSDSMAGGGEVPRVLGGSEHRHQTKKTKVPCSLAFEKSVAPSVDGLRRWKPSRFS